MHLSLYYTGFNSSRSSSVIDVGGSDDVGGPNDRSLGVTYELNGRSGAGWWKPIRPPSASTIDREIDDMIRGRDTSPFWLLRGYRCGCRFGPTPAIVDLDDRLRWMLCGLHTLRPAAAWRTCPC